MSKYEVIEGAIYHPFGVSCKPLSNEILTDAYAEHLLEKQPELLGTVIQLKNESKTKKTK
jgi:hypothetical protein